MPNFISNMNFEDIKIGMIVEKDGIRGKIESLLAQENSPSIYIEWDDGTISFPYHADCISIQLISPN